ncbi:hypothetical protein TSAR_008262 [Trichomalopsis sarcophagae]|uniref:Uncharacterized protein n=1 Tax=Trichomalopsis sarcophagae TaxID=543379 RepID=A0A232ET95_9HYME|nr:hypothetical protein TSAR_008262 [Trichomalopsis sarcophagae]
MHCIHHESCDSLEQSPQNKASSEDVPPVDSGYEADSSATSSDKLEEDLPSGSCKEIVVVEPEMKWRMQAHKVFIDCDCKLDPHNREYHSLRTLPYGYAEARLQPLEGQLVRSKPRSSVEKKLQKVIVEVKANAEKKLPKRIACTSPRFVPLGTAQQRRQRTFPKEYTSSNYHRRWNQKWE